MNRHLVRFGGWFFCPIAGGLMQRINQYEFYNLGVVLHPLAAVTAETKINQIHIDLWQARAALDLLLKGQPITFVVAKGEAEALRGAINAAMPTYREGMPGEEWRAALEKPLEFNAYLITEALRRFETVAAAELQTLDSYFVSKKGIYSTADLIEHTELALSETVRAKMPGQAIFDFRQAGRCLAFDLFTAAGFHVLRATDATLRSYYGFYIGKPAAPKTRNWGTYVRVLRGCATHTWLLVRPDVKTLELIDHIRDMHRNPIIHPEDNLDEDKALVLFDLCESAIVAMTTEVKEAIATLAKALP